jgi:Methane oxygenase PmoA
MAAPVSPQPQVIHTVGREVTVRFGEGALFRYVYVPDTPALESPKPYVHPVRTLAGRKVTLFRPHDHVWHKGIAMTWAQLSGQNFWGGPTYVRDRGYVQLPNNGRMEHLGWEEIDAAGTVSFRERLAWITAAGERWLDETRTIAVAEIAPEEGYWTLGFTSTLANTSGRRLVFGSPTTEGRPLAGYGGLFWRGPRSFLGGTILAAGGRAGPELMGQPAPWLAYVGRHDGSGDFSTLLFLDHPENPRFPNKWFVRNTPYACASFSCAFDEELPLEAGEHLALRYRVVVADGAWPRERLAAYAEQWPRPSR